MAISDYLRDLRAKVGNDLLVVPSVTGLVFDDRSRLLLVRHSNGGVWVAPGGAIDPDETPEDAVVRELWEETGLLVEPIALVGVFAGPELRVSYANGDESAYVMTIFECRFVAGELRADGEETLEARWVGLDDLGDLPLSRWARALLPSAIASRRQPWIGPVRWRPPTSA